MGEILIFLFNVPNSGRYQSHTEHDNYENLITVFIFLTKNGPFWNTVQLDNKK